VQLCCSKLALLRTDQGKEKTIAKKRVADVLVDTLVAAGVKRIYGLVGDSLNGATDSIRPRKDLQWVPVRHEETAAFAAGVEAQLTGRLTV
jgi:pyruvate dehydrogenase (quinone)